ncbi:MAG: YihY/virulence factor BrkB family protein [Acidimicrobiales bacterium]
MADRLARLLDPLDRLQRRTPALAFVVAVVRKTSEDGGGDLAALVAYYGFLSALPLLLVFASIVGFVLQGDPGLRARVLASAARSFPTLSNVLDSSVRGSGVALGLGALWALWAGLGVTRALERAMNAVWDLPRARRPGVLRSSARGLAMLAALGLLTVVSTALAGLPLAHALSPLTSGVVAVVGALAVNAVLFLLAFELLTNRHLGLGVTWPGAVIGAVAWTALQAGGTLYVGHVVAHASHYYGPFAAVVGLLAWVYLGARLLVYSAQINVVRTEQLWPRSLRGADRSADERVTRRFRPRA